MERFAIIRPGLEDSITQVQLARAYQISPRSNTIERRVWQDWQAILRAWIKESLIVCQQIQLVTKDVVETA
ncbi:hypothetical protein KDA_66460 [Dictyobacter alpinus]|uniref:Uncharacterized protein n=1 Tax=Dictyobacter alpinus TaxID=2014873 RepID=A0A402BIV1_9CHLR|nr:hypothetical protein KDA_66460 [Dictyobacter alpinus]